MAPGRDWSAVVGRALGLTAAVVLGACSQGLEGPVPAVDPPSQNASPPPVDPEILCRDQLTTEVTVHGEGFSIVPIDVPDAPKAALPSIRLTRGHALDGADLSSPDEIIYSGNPDADPTNALDADKEPLIVWDSQTQMRFRVNQMLTLGDGKQGMLDEGVWNVTVENANGATHESPESLAVVDRPTVSDVSPGIVCLAQGARTIDLGGRTFLRNEDAEVVLAVDGVDEPFAMALDACTKVAHDGLDAEVCDKASVELAEGSIDNGFSALTVNNPETAACHSTEDLKLRVVPPPAIDRVDPPMGCVTEEDREFVLSGTDFLRIDGQTPVVTIGGKDFTPSDMGGCETLDTQGHEVEQCTSLTFTVDKGALAPDLYEVTVTNPAPAGCDAMATGALRVVPPPAIEKIVPALECVADSAEKLTIEGADFLVVEGEVPAVAVDGDPLAPKVVDAEDCEDLEVDGLGVQKCATLTISIARDGAALGTPEIQVTNPDPAGCSDARMDLLTVIDRPHVSDLDPSIVCLDQGARTITLTGKTFLRDGDLEPSLWVDGVEDAFPAQVSDCKDIAQKGLDGALCKTATVELAQGSIEVGFPALTLQNPETGECVSKDDVKLRVVGPPVIDQVVPSLGCLTEEMRSFVIEGSSFLRIDGSDPAITVGTAPFAVDSMGGCEAVETQGHTVEACTSITFTAAQQALAPGLYPVSVANPAPAGCDATATGSLRIVPPPDITAIQPPLVCLDDGPRDITVMGTDFLVVDGAVPAVTVDGNAIDPAGVVPGGCADLEVDNLAVQTCTSLVVTVPQDGAGLGMIAVQVTNPAPAGCTDSRSDLLTVVAGPTITSAAPALLCTVDGSRAITISGTGFLKIDGTVPGVSIGGTAVTSVDSIADCMGPVTTNGVTVDTCATLHVSVAQGFLSSGRPEVAVTNPTPAGCTASRSDVLTVPPELMITSLEPPNVCQNRTGSLDLKVHGQGFLRVDADDFVFTFAGSTTTPTSISDCNALEVAGLSNVFSCDTIDATVDLTGLTSTLGPIPISVRNDNAPSCDLTVMDALNVVEPPTVTAIDIVGAAVDDQVCSDHSFTLILTGTKFADGATVTLSNDSASVAADMVTVDSATQITATWTAGLVFDKDDPSFDLVVDNGGGCATPTIIDAIDVNPTPLVFFVDPPVTYNEISIDVTVFTAGFSTISAVDTVELVDMVGTATGLTIIDNPKPNRIVVRVPGIDMGSGMPTFAAGDYEVRVTSTLGCQSELGGQFTITDTVNDALLTSIDPRYVSSTQATAVVIAGTGFLPGLRLYLTPSSGTGTAAGLRSVEVKSATQLTAVVPDGLTPGEYNLVLVSPSGEVDVLGDDVAEQSERVVVTVNEPPVIDGVIPASLAANASGTVTLEGSGFDTGGVQVELDCLLPDTTRVVVAGTGEGVNGQGTAATVTLDLTMGVPADPPAGSVCLVRLINGDGAFFEYSAFSVTTSSLNLSPWTVASGMTAGRRGLGLVAGRPTATSRYLYAVGGDQGVMNDPLARGTLLTSVEAATVDVFGAMGTWALQRNDLASVMVAGAPSSEPRTQAGSARIGRFSYLVGGHDGTGATDTLLRAQILDPLATPEIVDLDAELGTLDEPGGTLGLVGGLYYYRVAAIFPTDDAWNPGGESLPGEVLPVQLPDRSEGIVLGLTWEEIQGAHGYRVYRSPLAGDTVDEVELLAEVTCGALPTDTCDCATNPTECQLSDDGTLSTMPGETPMPEGSLGVWHQVDGTRCASGDCLLGTAREGLVTVAARDRLEAVAESDVWYLYAIGGRDAAGNYLATVEVARIVVTHADGSHAVSDFSSAGMDTLSSPRADLGAWVMNEDNTAAIRASGTPEDVWVYVGSGRTTGGASDRNLEASLVGANGVLASFIATDDLSADLTGLGTGAANGQLYSFGGQTSANGASAQLCAGGGGCGLLPDLQPGAWNSLAAATTDRMFMGYAQESAFFFLAGGHDGVSTLATTQKTVQ